MNQSLRVQGTTFIRRRSGGALRRKTVMPGLVPGIHAVRLHDASKELHWGANTSCDVSGLPHGVDARDKSGHDGSGEGVPTSAPDLMPIGQPTSTSGTELT